jgi:dienelactone hydrolase
MKHPLAILLFLSVSVRAAPFQPPNWNVTALSKPPASIDVQEGKVDGLQSFLLEGLPYQGRPTKFYAYVGYPANVTGRVPAVVLVHGGGGTATAPWVKYWNAKGYAALSLDTAGHLPVKTSESKPGRPGWKTVNSMGAPWGGQPPWPRGFADPALPPEEQWLYHAVADSILSVSYLASRPEVDSSRIGIVGISMGSIVCSIVGGLDPRLAFVVPQYIGGNNDLGNVWYADIKKHPEVMSWDPANFYRQPKGKAHWLWINGDNDKYGVPTMTTKSWRETGPRSWMTLLPTQGHGGIFGETGPNALREIYAFADSVTRGTPPLTRILSTKRESNEVTLTWRAQTPVTRAQIVHTTEAIPTMEISGDLRNDWQKVNWQVQDMPLPKVTALPGGSQQAAFPLPTGVKAAYINLIDERGLAVSSDFLSLQP